MRWTLIFLLCLAVASAKYMKKDRINRLLKTISDFVGDDSSSDDDWTDDDRSIDSDDDFDLDDDNDQWQRFQKQHHRHEMQKKKQIPHKSKKDVDEEHYESLDEDEESPSQKYKKHSRRERYREDEEPRQKCQPNYDLLPNLDQINLQLAAKLYRQAKLTNDDKNTVVSPVTVQLALAALSRGAGGNTKKQIDQLLNFGMTKNQNQNAHAALVKVLNGQGPEQSASQGVQIRTTTGIILSQQSAQEQFVATIKTCFDADVKKCDFRQQVQQCREQINYWVAGKTGHSFQHPLTPNAITQNTKMISISTLQVKANWGKQFKTNQKLTQGHFYPLGDQKSVPVKTLTIEGDFNYFEDNQMQVLGVQTQEKQLTVYIILPKQRQGLNHLEKQRLQYGKQLQQLLDNCDSKRRSLKVQLPLFQIVHKLDAKEMLRKLGVDDAFESEEADFTGIQQDQEEHLLKYGRRQTGGFEDIDVEKAKKQHQKEEHLHLNKFILQATIQINENGIDAANSKNQHEKPGKQKPKEAKKDDQEEDWEEKEDHGEFRVDHAFAYIVKHNPSGQVILLGRVIDATQQIQQDNQREQPERED